MSWVAVGVAGVNLIAGFSSRNDAEDQAERDRAAANQIEAGQLQLAQNQDRRGQQLFDHYSRTFQPRERAFVEDTFDNPISADDEEARSLVDVRSAFAGARRGDEQRQRSMGVNPASGAAAGINTARSLEEARIEGGARTRARSGVRDLNFNRQLTALNLANPNAALPFSTAAQTGVAQVSSLANARSRTSDDLAYEAGGNYGAAAGEFIDTGLNAWRTNRQANPTRAAAVPMVDPMPRNRDLMVA